MPTPFTFDDLRHIFHQRLAQLPDSRTGHNTPYRIHDAALGAFGLFFTQSPSCLEYQRHLQQTKGQNKVRTLLDAAQIPWDNQGRNLLDPRMPHALDAVFLEGLEGLIAQRWLANCRVLEDQLLLALAGTTDFSSKTIPCPNCLTRQTAKGRPCSSHPAITPVLVTPGCAEVIAFA